MSTYEIAVTYHVVLDADDEKMAEAKARQLVTSGAAHAVHSEVLWHEDDVAPVEPQDAQH